MRLFNFVPSITPTTHYAPYLFNVWVGIYNQNKQLWVKSTPTTQTVNVCMRNMRSEELWVQQIIDLLVFRQDIACLVIRNGRFSPVIKWMGGYWAHPCFGGHIKLSLLVIKSRVKTPSAGLAQLITTWTYCLLSELYQMIMLSARWLRPCT